MLMAAKVQCLALMPETRTSPIMCKCMGNAYTLACVVQAEVQSMLMVGAQPEQQGASTSGTPSAGQQQQDQQASLLRNDGWLEEGEASDRAGRSLTGVCVCAYILL